MEQSRTNLNTKQANRHKKSQNKHRCWSAKMKRCHAFFVVVLFVIVSICKISYIYSSAK